MNRSIAGVLIATLACAAVPVATAQDQERESAEAERVEAEKALAQAQLELEEAARQVAELSMQLHDPDIRQIRRIEIRGSDRAMLGINIGSAEPGTDGVRVISVSPGGPAAEAGVQAGDLVVAIDGRKVNSGRDLIDNMRSVEPGQKVALDLRRAGKQVTLAVIARPAADMVFSGEPGMAGHGLHGMPPMPHFLVGPWGDAELVEMTPALGRYFGTDKGLLLVRAPSEVGADLEEGDVILSIGGREPQNAGHALRILGSYQPGETIDLRLLRQKKERTVRITVPERPAMKHHVIVPPPPAPPQGG